MEKNNEEENNDNGNKPFKKYASGIIIVKSKNSNFNSDFTGTPRRLPDENGTVYATDKSLKYCIRKYLHDTKEQEEIFVWRRKKNDDQPMDIIENFNSLFSKNPNDIEKVEILNNLLSCIDVRLFGVTFTPKTQDSGASKNTSITGPIQISYGLNKFEENTSYTNQILSPYRDTKDKDAQQTTIGEESKGLEFHYIFDYTINYKHLEEDIKHLQEANNENKSKDKSKALFLSQNDIELFKEASRLGVNYVNSTTMIGSEIELFLYLEYSKSLCLQNLKDFIKVSSEQEKTSIDLTLLKQYLVGSEGIFYNSVDSKDNNDSKTEQLLIEIYYEPLKTNVIGFASNDLVTKKNLITKKKISTSSK